MGVKCGEDIDRHEAEKLYAELKFKTEYNRILRAEAVLLDNRKLASELTRMNDIAKGGEGFIRFCVLDE